MQQRGLTQRQESCTLSIVMLDWFGRRGSLPGRGPGGYQPFDTATFRDVWGAARLVETDCLLPTRRPGWDAIGKTRLHTSLDPPGLATKRSLPYDLTLSVPAGAKSSIGVFLWATDSPINDQVTGRGQPMLKQSPNGSTIANTDIASTT